MKALHSWLPLAAIVALTACPTPVKTERIELTPSALALQTGEARVVAGRLVVVEDGTVEPLTGASWESSDVAVATVATNADGTATVTAVGAGSATITVSQRTATATVSVLVTARPRVLSRLEVTPATPSLAIGTTLQLTATGIYTDDSREDLTASVTWRSSSDAVLSVTQAGLATGVTEGTATVTASQGSIVGNVSATVTAAQLARIEVTPALPMLAQGFSVSMTATGIFSDDSRQDLTSQVSWTSADAAIATVSSAGVVTGVSGGTTAVRATRTGITGETMVTVSSAQLMSLEVTPMTPSLPRGTTLQLAATARFSDGTTRDVSDQVQWSSSAPGVMTVSNDAATRGLATALSQGTADAIATFGTATGRTTVTVTSATLTSIAVTPAPATVAKGLTRAFTATGTYSDGATADLTALATWSSSDTTVATVSNAQGSYGRATALSLGTTTVTATRGAVSGTAALTVSAAELVSLAVTPAAASVALGLTQDYVATGTFTDGSTQVVTTQVTWSVTNATAASISNAAGTEGRLTPAAVGSTTVRATFTATSGAIAGQTTATIVAAALTSLEVTPTDPSVARGGTQQLVATGRYTDNTTAVLTNTATWASATTAVATVTTTGSARGLLTAVSAGTSVVTATVGSISGSTTVTVLPASLVSLAVTPVAPSVAKGLGQAFIATGTYSDTTTADVTDQATWTSGTLATATISNAAGQRGVATTLAEGTSTITATIGAISGTATLTVTAPALVSIAVTGSSTTLRRGDTLQLTATGTYTDASTADVTASATWSSGASGVASVSDVAGTKGLVTGVSVGGATVSAGVGSVTGSLALTVTLPGLVSIAVTPAAPMVLVGATPAFVATGTYSDTTTAVITDAVTWASSNAAVATISDASGTKGQAQALTAGTSTISATQGAVSGSTLLTVSARSLVSLAVTPATPSVAKGRTQAFTATGTYSDTTTEDLTASVTWTSSDETKATIASTGVASTVAEGTTTITATSGSVSGTATLTVTAPVLESLAISGPGTIEYGHGGQLFAIGTMSDATTQDLTASVSWTTSSPSLLVVDVAPAKGSSYGVSVGDTTVTATLGALTATHPVRVRQGNAPATTKCSTGLVISQLFGSGGLTNAPFRSDYVELHNAGSSPVSLSGMSVQYASTSGTTWSVRTLGTGTVQPGDYYLVQLNTNGTTAPALSPDFTTATNLDISGSNGKFALVSDAVTLSGSCPLGGTVVDFVGYGTANCSIGGTAAPALSATTALFRGVSGCQSVQVNGTDFGSGTPAPRSLATSGILCDCNVTGTGDASEADYCALQFPATLSTTVAAVSDPIYTRVFEDTVTQPAGAAAQVRVEVGYGPAMSDPSTSPAWTWWGTTYNLQVGNDDEYQGRLLVPSAGSYSYTGRVTLDGVNWTSCDLNGAGANTGLDLETSQLGVMTVAP